LQEIAWTVIAYLQGNAVLSIGIAFIAGFAAHKSVTRDAKSGILLVLIVGLSGLFLGEFLLLYTGLMEFLEKLPDLVGLYRNPPDKELVLCVDEKSPIQALDRTQPLLPLRAGIAARQTHDDKRNGTPPLFAAWRRLDGKLIGERTHSPASDRGWHVTPGFICILSRPRVPGCTGSNAGSAKSPTNGCVEEPLHVNGL